MKKLLLLLLSIAFFGISQAQIRITGFGLQSVPMFGMKQQGYLSGAGFGMGAYGTFNLDSLFSLDVGGSFYTSSNGSRSGSSPIGLYTVDNSSGGIFLESKLLMNLKYVSPYLEVHYGTIDYSTQESVAGVSNQLLTASTTNYGAGLGVLFKVVNNFYLDFGMAVNGGNNASFLDLHSFSSKANVIDYNVNTANSSMVIFKLGIALTLNFPSGNYGSSLPYYSSSSPVYYNSSGGYYSTSQNSTTTNSSGTNSSSGTIVHRGKTPVGIVH
jgi:hypothetical protein